MKNEERLLVEHKLQEIPPGQLVIRKLAENESGTMLTDSLQVETEGKGLLEVYRVFPGVEASFALFLGSEIAVRHPESPALTELFYCQSGRVGWNMKNNLSIYLGAGDLTTHSSASCGSSSMMFPLGYARGVSVSLDWDLFPRYCPDALQSAKLDYENLNHTFCSTRPVVIPACEPLKGIFAPLYAADPSLRLPYLKLKIQELLLYFSRYSDHGKMPNQYVSQQTELIREIHDVLTCHLDRRFTIEELSKQYAINTSTLKAVFKAVYGMPIAAYMKEYRIRRAMELLRQTNDTIAQIAEQVGYESQGKFTIAFKDVTQMLPSTYRKGGPGPSSG